MITASKRLQKEFADYRKHHDKNDEVMNLKPNEENIMRWEATIRGPQKSFYEGFGFDLAIEVPMNYPLVPPTIRFRTKIFWGERD